MADTYNVNPTRMELKKMKIRYANARRGHKLLKDKRDGLMKQFLETVRQNKELREKVEAALSGVYDSLAIAGAVSGPRVLEESLMLPKKQGNLDVRYRNVMSVTVPEFELEVIGKDAQDSYNYGLVFTSGELDASLAQMSSVMEDMIALAESEKTVQLLAQEIEKTRRRVNALEYIMIPKYLATIKSIKMKLDENDRGNTTRLMKVKDMMLKAQRESARSDEDEEEEGA
ncbi:MAG: V-type ATP synthase subunit D [Clostridia bacterium]|nr:V-type ATP synthase subunit D [Clostridia bacterium]MBQ2255687.1 V-type ATP synthase subunit D [Clostridia bacterium]MBQ5793619.1 V-type ATP synthase subunit D [Clostridia bacterium]